MKQKFYIDIHKGITGLVVLGMMALHDQWDNPTAWIYLALHGSYGVFWVLKSNIFPDKSWERVIGLGYGLVNWAGLSLYWIAPWILTSQDIRAPGWHLGLCVTLYVFGVFFHFSTDMQKFTSLRLEPNQLITSGFMRHTRNMNYLGELLIYLGFGLLAMHWVPLLILALFVVIIWIPNMLRKDRSLSRYADFTEYERRSKFFIPFLF